MKTITESNESYGQVFHVPLLDVLIRWRGASALQKPCDYHSDLPRIAFCFSAIEQFYVHHGSSVIEH